VSSASIDILLRKLKALRLARGWTQEEFAERADVSYKYYQAVEAGRKRQLRLATVDRLAAAFGVAAWQILSPDLESDAVPKADRGVKRRGRSKLK
jgi:transcriptional regulator with XRE-family HTH domain